MEENENVLAELKLRNTHALETMQDVVRTTTTNRVGRFLSSSFYTLLEYLLYAIALVCMIFTFSLERVAPFSILRQLKASDLSVVELNAYEINNLSLIIRITMGLLALFIAATAYAIGRNRKYKASVQDAMTSLKDVKTNLEQNNKQLDDIEAATSKVVEASMIVANEAKLKK